MKIRGAMVDRPSICNDRNQPNGPLGFITLWNNPADRFSGSSESPDRTETASPRMVNLDQTQMAIPKDNRAGLEAAGRCA
jgi:hypothetical protein